MDKLAQLRSVQRALDRALAARAHARKRLDEVDERVRTARLMVKTILEEVQLSLLPSGESGAGELPAREG